MDINERLMKQLKRPQAPIDVVMDTDTFNEIDDQFALAYMLCCPEKLRVRGLYAAPFMNEKVASPAEGMRKSRLEIERILDLMGLDELRNRVHDGAERFMDDESRPVDSDAARDLIRLAMTHTPDNPLYVAAIAAVTDVASALLMEPAIRDRVVVVWLGGHDWCGAYDAEFNMRQDIAAARVLFASGAAVVQLPCKGVVDRFSLSQPEMERWMTGQNALCDYLMAVTIAEAVKHSPYRTWTRVIWDAVAVGWLLDGAEEMVKDVYEHSPAPAYDHLYGFSPRRHFIKRVYSVNRDALMQDMITRLTAFGGGGT